MGHHVVLSYFAPHQAEELDPSRDVLQTVDDVASGDIRRSLRSLLGAFLFSGDDVYKSVRVLSGGEKSRLALAKMLLKPANLVVLDEPTNHLDMRSKLVLQDALLSYEGSCVIVSHDRDFLDPLVTRVAEVRNGRYRTYLGNISDYIEARKWEEQTAEGDRKTLDDLRRLPIPVQSGKVVPLENAAELVQVFSPTQIERKYQQRIVHLTANTVDRDLGSIAQEIEKKVSQMKIPEGFTVNLKGARLEQKEAFRMLMFALVLAVVLIYMVLASQFGSLLHPFLIMFSVPLGFIGVVWALFLTHNTLSVISFIGIIMMVGVVVSNAIILVEYINRLREEHGVELREAIVRDGRIRLRPAYPIIERQGLEPAARRGGKTIAENSHSGVHEADS